MPTPTRRFAGLRETGTLCPHCQTELHTGEDTAVCVECGSSQHWHCWQSAGGCGSYECSTGRSPGARNGDGDVLRVSLDDLNQARPLPVRRPTFAVGPIPISLRIDDDRDDSTPRTWNKLAIAALILSLLGVPLLGVPGLIGIVLGAIALAKHSRREKGLGVAITGLLLGIADCIGWVIVLAFYFEAPGIAIRLDDFEPDPAALKQLPPQIARSMAANALVHSAAEWGRLRGEGLGSGVVLRIKDATALIVTNRHVVDPSFTENSKPDVPALDKMSKLDVKLLGQAARPASVVWVAPGGIDLALIRVAVTAIEPQAAEWDDVPTLTIGDDVFAVGNPHGLGWTLTRGSLSQMRLNDFSGHETRIIQTSAAINPGNSGGGLYDKAGKLIGINTWTKDKRMAEGLSFAITFTTLLDLAPAEHELRAK